MWTRSALFWSKTLFITIKCHILPCLASLIGTVTGMQKTIYDESTNHVSWCYCKTIRKTVQVSTNTQGCPSYPICSYSQEQEHTVSTYRRDNSCEIQQWQTKWSAVFVDKGSLILVTTLHMHLPRECPQLKLLMLPTIWTINTVTFSSIITSFIHSSSSSSYSFL